MIIVLVTKNKILVVTYTCNYKPYSHFGQVAKDSQSQKTPCGMYSHPYSRISLTTAWIFHPLTSGRTMRLQIQLYKILGSIFLIIKIKMI
jgi:hypothetical protein